MTWLVGQKKNNRIGNGTGAWLPKLCKRYSLYLTHPAFAISRVYRNQTPTFVNATHCANDTYLYVI